MGDDSGFEVSGRFQVRFKRDKFNDLKVTTSWIDRWLKSILIGLGCSVGGAAIWHYWL